MTANTTGPASKTHPIELLRSIDPGAWADVRDPSGWTYSTNIGVIAQTCRAAWEADRAALERARALETKLRDRGKAPHLYSENERVMFIAMADELAALLAAPAGGEQP